jgi:penicillin-binding protein 2
MGASPANAAAKGELPVSVLDGGFSGPSGPSRNRPHGNLRVLRLAVVGLFAILTARLISMQIVDGNAYAQRSRENHIRATNLLPARGLIFDRNGEQLVDNVGIYTATIVPEFLPETQEERTEIYLWMEHKLGVPALEIQQRVKDAETDRIQGQAISVQKYLTKDQAIMLEEAATAMPGVSLTITPGRDYRTNESFSHILGFVGPQTTEEFREFKKKGYQLNERVGKGGLESRYESDLRGSAGVSANEVDAQGHLIQSLKTQEAVPGSSLRLSIDKGLQEYVWDLLESSKQEAKVAAAVVMSPKTGEIFALASYPAYDNNIFAQADVREAEYNALLKDDRKPLLNWALSAAAPGSTFKLITAAAALQEGRITPQTTRYVPNAKQEIKTETGEIDYLVDWKPHGLVDLYSGIAWSSNIYFFQASCGILGENKGLGSDVLDSAVRLGTYARMFGLGQATGIDIDAGEADGVIPSPDQKRRVHSGSEFNPEDREWYYSDTCFMGIGQGDVAATPLQIARMTAAVANGGTLLTPRVVAEVISPDGTTIHETKIESKQVPVNAQYLADIRRGMHESVGYGAGSRAAVAGLDIAGKTGTAEFFLNNVKYQHAWFTGFAPFDDPEVVVTVYFDLGVGGDKAAPVAGKILDYYFQNVKR